MAKRGKQQYTYYPRGRRIDPPIHQCPRCRYFSHQPGLCAVCVANQVPVRRMADDASAPGAYRGYAGPRRRRVIDEERADAVEALR
jgi:hypothetical protein